MALLTIDELQDGYYVEGFAVPEMKDLRLPVEHGWVELPDGVIIDVTYAVLQPERVAYFPVLRITSAQARLVTPHAQ